MTLKDRRIHFFLQLFFLFTGLYQFVQLAGAFQSGPFSENLFEFHQNNLPALNLAAGVIVATASLVSSFSLWSRASWAYGCTLFTTGLLFSYLLIKLSAAIYQNSYEIIPIVLILIVLLQSFPYLLRRSYRPL